MMQASTSIIRLRVLIDQRPVQEYRGPGNNTFIQGIHLKEFELELSNLTPRRLLVHPVVDGLSAMTGELASKNDSKGYVMSPWQVSTVPGWRLNNSEIAKFVFSTSGNSYAEQTNKGGNNGVIACTVWEELYSKIDRDYEVVASNEVNLGPIPCTHSRSVSHTTHSREVTGSTCCSIPNQNITAPCLIPNMYCATEEKTSGNLGTGFGAAASHQVHSVAFVPHVEPACVAIIYYDDIAGLQKRGIRICADSPLPNPFPNDGCKPPAGWCR
jgi:hypothetical protein